MRNVLQQLEVLSSNLIHLKLKETLEDKCMVILDTLRKSGWGWVSLSFLNSKYETTKTLFSGYSDEEIVLAKSKTISPIKRKELLSSTVEKWRIGSFYYLPWREPRVREIISGGMKSDIPVNLKDEWNDRDMLYVPIYYKTFPVAVLSLDKPHDRTKPSRVSLRAQSIVHSYLIEVFKQYIYQENFPHSQILQKTIFEKGTIGVIKLDELGKISSINIAAEHILNLEHGNLINTDFLKLLSSGFLDQFTTHYNKTIQTLEVNSFKINYISKNKKSEELNVKLFPIHILYEYRGMICLIDYPESTDIYKIYANTLAKLDPLTSTLQGDIKSIQDKLIDWLRNSYGFTYPRIYELSEDETKMECKYFFDPSIKDIHFFDHSHNRNSLASSALIENKILYTTVNERRIRDVRRIRELLKTKGAIAIPTNVIENSKTVLVCDFDSESFVMDMSKEIIFKFFANILILTLKI
ncbi:MAG: hypothetical protein KAT41_06905 [Candidatus Marinimicrobia bacterium]|nr:hypothetical protein [Candidatus Neomarinimicrobiota bacterium]